MEDTKTSLHKMFNPKSIAFIGASSNFSSMSTTQLFNTYKRGFKGKLYPVHPREKSVLGLPAYKSILDIPGPVDLVVITIPAKVIPQIFEECYTKGVHYAVITSGGFSEIGEEGKSLEKEILDLAHRFNIRFIGPNCLGIINSYTKLNLSMFPHIQEPGNLGFVSQSGSYITQVLDGYLQERGIRFSRALSIGNKADIDLTDCLEYLGEDEDTKAIALYIEGLKRPNVFLEVAREVTRKKPVVAIYVGGTEAGARSAASHTAAICAPAKLFSDMLRQAGVIEADNMEDLFLLSWALANQPFLKNNRIAVLTGSGGPATSIADACNKVGLVLPSFTDETLEALKPMVPETASVRNPVDLTFNRDPFSMLKTMSRIVIEDSNIDGLIIHGVFTDSIMKHFTDIAGDLAEEIAKDFDADQVRNLLENAVGELSELSRKYEKPVTCSSFVGPKRELSTKIMQDYNIPTYDTPEKAVKAMEALYLYGKIRER